MKIKEYKNKIVLAELNPDAEYIMLFNPAKFIDTQVLQDIHTSSKIRIYYVPVTDVEKSVKFVEVPKHD